MRKLIASILAFCFTLVISKSKYNQIGFEAILHLSGYNFTYSTLKTSYNIPSASKCAAFCDYPNCLSFTYNDVDKVCRLFARRFLCPYTQSKVNNTIYYVKKAVGQSLHHYEQDCTKIVPTECQDLHVLCCENKDGHYDIYPVGKTSVKIYCLMQSGGWTVFQRRMDGSVDFYKSWAEYENFFGSITGEYWLGNKIIHGWTSGGKYQLRVDLEDFEGNTTYAEYTNFALAGTDSKYTITALGFSGTAEDSLAWHNGKNFTTYDHDNDVDTSRNCAVAYGGAWWYAACHSSNLNGKYLRGPITGANGMIWRGFRGLQYSLKACTMAFRRGTF